MLAVVILLIFAAAIMLLVSRSKENVERASLQTTGAPAALAKVDLALKSFVASQKRLPCPANPTDATGVEAFTGTTATCSHPAGVIPWGSLGLTSNDALDTWNRKVSYRVYSGATGFTQADGLNAVNCNSSTYLTTGVGVSIAGACQAFHETRQVDFLAGKGVLVNDKGTLNSGVAYVLISHGATGNGAFGNDVSGTRTTLPNVASKEYPNAQVPMDNTYWIQEATASTVSADIASHFDDVVYYKLASELLNDTNMGGRDWGTVSVDKSFSSSSVTTGGAVTLTITLSSTMPLPSKLAIPLVDNFPTNLVVFTTPNASTTCGSGTVSAAAGATSVSLSAGAIVPARVAAVPGTCTITVSVSPTQPVMLGAAAINYSNTIAQYALEVTPNMGATAPPPTDAAAIRNLSASPTRVLTATPPPPIVTPTAGPGGTISPASPQTVSLNSTVVFTVTPNTGYTAAVGGSCGGSLVGNTYTTSPITSNCDVAATFTLVSTPVNTILNRTTLGTSSTNTGLTTISLTVFTLSAFADPPNIRNISTPASGGIGAVTTGGSVANLTTSNNEGLRILLNSDYLYFGFTLLNFASNASGTTRERVRLTFYDASDAVVSQITKLSCRQSPTTANFFVDPGVAFRKVDIQARTVSSSSTSSSFLLNGVAVCATGTAATCAVSGAPAVNDCP